MERYCWLTADIAAAVMDPWRHAPLSFLMTVSPASRGRDEYY